MLTFNMWVVVNRAFREQDSNLGGRGESIPLDMGWLLFNSAKVLLSFKFQALFNQSVYVGGGRRTTTPSLVAPFILEYIPKRKVINTCSVVSLNLIDIHFIFLIFLTCALFYLIEWFYLDVAFMDLLFCQLY